MFTLRHLAHAHRGALDQRRQQVRFRQMLPVTLRHLLPHHPRVQARRIEDMRVVGAPQVLAGIERGRIVGRTARTEAQGFAIPQRAALRGEDRPAHAGEPACEERRDPVQDVMRWLEPGDEVVALPRHFAEAHEGLHLVRVAADLLRQLHHPPGVGVGGRRQHMRLAVGDAPQQAIQQRVPLRIAVAEHGLGDVEERTQHARRRVQHGRVEHVGQRQQATLAIGKPLKTLGCDAGAQRGARGLAKRIDRPRGIHRRRPHHRHCLIRTGRPGAASARVAPARRRDRPAVAADDGRWWR